MISFPLRCIVFDCDGVLLDSVAVKTRAFAQVAEPFGAQARDRLLLFHHLHGGVSRYEKFRWLYTDVLGRQPDEGEIAVLARRFADCVEEELRVCPLIAGARETLERWHGLLPLYVCSGAPQEDVRAVLSTRGLAHFFTGIHGTPPHKAALLQRIVDEALVLPEETLLVGDSSTDMRAAEAVGTQFYACGPDLRSDTLPWGPDLRGLNQWIAARCEPAAGADPSSF